MGKGGATAKSRNAVRNHARDRKYPKRPMRRLPVVRQRMDRAMVEAGKQHDLSCTKGCAHCCYQMVTVSLVEALAIIDFIWQRSNRATHFKARSLAILREQADLFTQGKVSVKMWFELNVPCVFLTQDNLCSIYDVRPTACRTYAVVSPPKDCSFEMSGSGHKVGKIDNKELVVDAFRESTAIAKKLGVPDTYSPMPVALLLALKLFSDGPEAYIKSIHGTMYTDPLEAATFWSKMEMQEL